MSPQITSEPSTTSEFSPQTPSFAKPKAIANRTPLKALVGGVLIGVVVGGFVSPMAAKLSIPFPAAEKTSASPAQISSSAAARAVIQDARVATTAYASPVTPAPDAGQPLIKLSNAGGETGR